MALGGGAEGELHAMVVPWRDSPEAPRIARVELSTGALTSETATPLIS